MLSRLVSSTFQKQVAKVYDIFSDIFAAVHTGAVRFVIVLSLLRDLEKIVACASKCQ